MTKTYYAHGVVWIPIAQFAREFNKSKVTILRWIADGFILQMGYCVRRDHSGHYYVGKSQSSQLS